MYSGETLRDRGVTIVHMHPFCFYLERLSLPCFLSFIENLLSMLLSQLISKFLLLLLSLTFVTIFLKPLPSMYPNPDRMVVTAVMYQSGSMYDVSGIPNAKFAEVKVNNPNCNPVLTY